MTLTNYISDLLYRYECVIVPEFGAFLTHRNSATIDKASNVLLPPRKVLSFNEQLKQNDGLLANHVAVTEKVTYEEALSLISNAVVEIKRKMVEGETITLSKVGHFSINTEGNIQFNPIDEVNYLTAAFGLQPTMKAPVLREIYKEEVEVLEEKAPIAFTPETRAKKPYWKYAAAAVVILGLSGFLGNAYVEKKNVEVAEHNSQVNIDANKMAYEKASFFDIAPIEVPEVTFKVAIEKKNTGKYHIVAGAFRFEENADKKIMQLEDNGYTPRKIGKNKYGLHQVVYASYETRREAKAALNEIKQTNDRKAWLLVKDLTE